MCSDLSVCLELLSLVSGSHRERGKRRCTRQRKIESDTYTHIEALRKRSGEGSGSHRKSCVHVIFVLEYGYHMAIAHSVYCSC